MNYTEKDFKENPKLGFEEAFMTILSNKRKYAHLSFYAFILSSMETHIDKSTPTAGAGFYNSNFHLHINPDFFNPLPVEQRIGILQHEALHVILKHLFRKGERDHKLYNVAADIALNQKIDRSHLPKGALFPDSFKDSKGKPWPSDQTAEFYYALAKKEKEDQEEEKANSDQSCDNPGDQNPGDQNGDGNGDGDSEGDGQSGQGNQGGQGDNGFRPKNGNPNLTGGNEPTIDDHGKWGEINPEDEELANETMGKIIEKAMEKSRGNTPQNISELLELWKAKPKLSWKKILKRYLSSKKGARQSTIKRRNRRIRQVGIKGNKVSYDTPNVIVGLDVSGSMSDEEIITALAEINEVCKVSNSTLEIVQIDTNIKGSEEYDPKKKSFKRKGMGGTYMGAMAEYLLKEKIDYDVLVMISDMYIEDVSTDANWSKMKKPTLWLNTSGTDVSWEGLKRHVIYNISDA